MWWVGVRKEGDDVVCKEPAWCLAHLASDQNIGVPFPLLPHKAADLCRGWAAIRSEQPGRWHQWPPEIHLTQVSHWHSK